MTKHNGRSREEVVEIINSVLVTHKKSMTYGMPIAQLEGEYKEQDGVRIPFRELGYPTLLEFLQSLVRSNQIVIGKRDSMTVVYPRINERIAHVSALVARQKDSTNNKRYARGGRRATISRYPRMTYLPVEPPRLDSQTLADVVKLIKKTPDGMHVDKILEYVQDRNNCNMNKEHLIRQLRELYHEINVHYDRCYPINNNENGSTPACPQKNASSTNGYAAQQTSSTGIRPAGLSDSDDDKETFDFVRNEKKDVSTERRLPPEDRKDERVACEESKDLPPPNDENANAYHDEDENRKADVDDDIGILVNSRTRFRLEKLIQQHPGGIWCADLPKLYQKEYGFPLNYEDLGFDSVSDFASHLPDIFYYVRLQDKGDFKLFDAKAPKPEARQSARPEHLSLAALHNIYQHYGEEEEAVPVLLSSSTSQRLVPEGVMTVGETVAQIYVTALFPDESGTVDVVVVDVATPTFFWIQLLKKTAKFRRFMTDLHTFYSSNASKYVIPIVLLERGLNCACIFDGKWHRGLIKAVKPDNTVTVMFYDYGTVLSYPPEDIHFLHRSFSSLPAQAIPCGLYTVRPIASDKWSYSVSQEFVEKVLDVPLVAMLGTIDEENNSMLITLTNTNGPVDIHINDWMVSSGYAVYGKMVCIRPPNFPFRWFLQCASGTTTDFDKKTSNSGKNIRLTVKADAQVPSAPAPKETNQSLEFYEALLKMRRKCGRISLESSCNTGSNESGSRREEPPIVNAATSQKGKTTTSDAGGHVVQAAATYPSMNDNVVSQNFDKRSSQRGRDFGPELLKKLCERHANHMAAMNAVGLNHALDGEKSFRGSAVSTGSSSSASVVLPECRDAGAERSCESGTSHTKRNANLAKLLETSGFKLLSSSTKSNEISGSGNSSDKNVNGNERAAPQPTQATPLHLRPEIAERRRGISEYGAIYSAHGGHGRMEPIDWNAVRNEGTSARTTNERRSARPPSVYQEIREPKERRFRREMLNIGEKTSAMHQREMPIPEKERALFKHPQEMTKPKETASAIHNSGTQKPKVNASLGNSHEAMPKPQEKTLSQGHRETLKLDEKTSSKHHNEMSKPEEKISSKHHNEMSKPEEKISSKHHHEMSRQDAKDSSVTPTSIPEVTPTRSGSAKIPAARKAFLNLVIERTTKKEVLPDFGDFRSKFGGNGRMEPIAWDELRNAVEGPQKIAVIPIEPSKPVKKAPVDLPPARKGFVNIVNHGLPPANERTFLCGPEGNIKRTTDVSPRLRMIVKVANEERGDKKLRLYIPDDVAGLLREDGCTEDSTSVRSNSSTSTSLERPKSSAVDPTEMLLQTRIKSTVRYENLDRSNSSAERSSSDTAPATTESESSLANHTSSDFNSGNDASEPTSADTTKSTEELLKSFSTSVITSPESPAAARSDDVRVTSACPAESIKVAEKAMSPQPDASREKKSQENADNRVDSVVRKVLRCSFQSSLMGENSRSTELEKNGLGTGVSIVNAGKSVGESVIAKTGKITTDSVSVSEEPVMLPSSTSEKTTNAWIQNASLKSTTSILTTFFNFVGSRGDSHDDPRDDSDLDSDDVSFDDDANEHALHNNTLKTSTNETHKFVNEESGFSRESDEVPSKICQDFDSSTQKPTAVMPLDKESQLPKEKGKFVADKDDEASRNCDDIDVVEKSVCTLKNTDESSLQIATKIPNGIPCYDDTCVASDSDEWDYGPGCGVIPSYFGEKLKSISDSEDEIVGASSLVKLENNVTRRDSNFDEVSVDNDTSRNQQSDVIGLSDDSLAEPRNSAEQDTMRVADTSNIPGSSHTHDCLASKDRIVDCDERSSSIDKLLNDSPDNANNNDNVTVSTPRSYSILREIQMSNISATTEAKEDISSSSSCSYSRKSSDGSYATSLMRAFKKYL